MACTYVNKIVFENIKIPEGMRNLTFFVEIILYSHFCFRTYLPYTLIYVVSYFHSKQKGTIRTNCLDCLDRTNCVQTFFGLEV
jgi:hypothetical protein